MLLDHVAEARRPLLLPNASSWTSATSSSSSSSSPSRALSGREPELERQMHQTASPCQGSPRSLASDLSTCADLTNCVTPVAKQVDEEGLGVKSPHVRQLFKELQKAEDDASSVSLEQPTSRAVFWVVLPAFGAYAALFALQHEVKAVYGIADDDSAASHDFSAITSLLYVFSLAFRFLHSIVFCFLESRSRVYMAIAILMTSMSLLVVLTAGLLPPHFSFLVVAYSLGGIGVGTFESNLMSCLTGLGDGTKKYATVAIPVGVCLVQVGGFFLLQLGVAVHILYAMVMLGLLVGAATLKYLVPVPVPMSSAPASTARVMDFWRTWREWLPHMWSLPPVMAVDMFYLSCFSPGVMLFIYDRANVVLLSPPVVMRQMAMPTDLYFVVYNLCLAVGGCTGRWLAYTFVKTIHPAWYTVLPAVGASIVILGAPGQCLGAVGPALAPISALLIALGDGFVYCTISRTIDEKVPAKHNLAAVSCWFFVGDWGSVIGSNLIPYIHDWVVG